MWQFYHHSLVLFPRRLLTVVVVIVYRFGRPFALPLFFSLLLFLFPDCVCRQRGGGLLRPCIYPSIHLFPASFFFFSRFFFFFFSFVAYNENWHEKLEMTEKRRWRHSFFSCFSARFLFFFLLSVRENASTYFISRISFKNTTKKKRK